jgi:hypothetical protein
MMTETSELEIVGDVTITRNARGRIEGWQAELSNGELWHGWFERGGEPNHDERHRLSNAALGKIDDAYAKAERE